MDEIILKEYCNNGLSSYAIAKLENVSPTTIRYWLGKYNLKTNGWFGYEENELRKIITESKSRNEVLCKLNKNNSSGSYKSLNRAIKRFGIDITHFMSRSEISKGIHLKKEIGNNEMFVENSETSRATIKRRILRDKLIEYKCFKCGGDDNWNGEKLVLILDHANGVNNDNKLKNLRFVCSNCNSQLPTHCKKNASVAQLD